MSREDPLSVGLPLRAWQRRALAALSDWQEGPFLLSAAPGAGKTRPALEYRPPRAGGGARMRRVVVACPTAPLTRQWARAAHQLGLELAPDRDSPRPPRGFHGVVGHLRADREGAAPLGAGAAATARS